MNVPLIIIVLIYHPIWTVWELASPSDVYITNISYHITHSEDKLNMTNTENLFYTTPDY